MNTDQKEQVRICHFSDLHLPLSKRVPLPRLIGKRSFGYINIKFLRRKYKLASFLTMLNELAGERADLVVMTGDLTSLAFGFEFDRVERVFLEAGLTPENTLIVPGNHDRYTAGADFTCAFEKAMVSWFPPGFSRALDYPISRIVGPVVLAALNTAVWRSPIRSAGYVAHDQIVRLIRLLDSDSMRGLWPVVAMHHPPFHLREALLRDYRNGLDGLEELMGALGDRSATVLHGHLHRLSRRKIAGLDVIGVPSASHDAGEESTRLAYHVYTFDRTGLIRAEAVRHWPGDGCDKPRFERVDLPDKAFAD